MIQAIGYVRRSTDRQEESLDQQRAKLDAFAKSHGWTLKAVYSDDAISGSDMRRPGLERLMDDACTQQDVQVVLAWDRNRLARPKDAVDGMLLEHKLMDAGKRIVYAGTGQEAGRSFASGLMSYVEHHQNGDYLRKLSRDTMRGLVSRVQRGRWPGGPIPFGYDRLILDHDGKPKLIVRDESDGSQVVIDPASGEVIERVAVGRTFKKQDDQSCTLIPSEPARVRAVVRMFADYAAGVPTRKLREWLNASGFRTSRGGMFTIPTISPILENPAYLGQCVYNRRTLSKWHRYLNGSSVERADEKVEHRPASDWIVTDDAWPALVDRPTFDQVQARRRTSRENYSHARGQAIRADYQLVGLMYCGVCGSRMMGQTITSGKGYRTRYYICSGHHKGHKDKCPTRYTVPGDVVEGHVWKLIRADLERLRDDQRLHQYIAEELRRVSGGQSDARDQLRRRQAELDQQAAKLRDHLLALDPDAAKSLGFYDQAKLLADQRAEVERELAKLPGEVPALPDADQVRERAAVAFDNLEAVIAGGTLEEKRDLIASYVQKIKAEPDTQVVRISLYPALFTQKIEWSKLSYKRWVCFFCGAGPLDCRFFSLGFMS